MIFLKQQILPHSFLNYIYVNGDQYLNGEIDEKLLAHEMAHVKQKHSWDIIFIELIHMIFWFNPILKLPFWDKFKERQSGVKEYESVEENTSELAIEETISAPVILEPEPLTI